MEWNVWSLKHVTRAHRDVIVILLAWNRFSNRVTDEIARHTTEFGHLMKYRGVLVMPYPERMQDALNEVLEKPWPEALSARIRTERYPFLLLIDADFEAFDPVTGRSAFVWFSDFRQNEEPIWQVFDAIGHRVEAGEDAIAYLTSVAEKARAGRFRARLAKLSKYVDVSIPLIPGVVSVNAGAVWADLLGD